MRRAKCWVMLAMLGASVGCFSKDTRPTFLTSGGEAPQENQIKLGELSPRETVKVRIKAAEDLAKNGKDAEAINLYEQARAVDPSQKIIARRLAVLYDRVGDFAKAEVEYQAAFKHFPKDADLFNDAGYSQFRRGNWTAAEDYLRKALELKPDHQRAQMNLAFTLIQQGQRDAAFDVFCKFLTPGQAHCNIAFGLTAKGDREAAKAEYRLAIAKSPDLELARNALAKLEMPAPQPSAESKVVTAEAKVPAKVDESPVVIGLPE